MMLSDQLRELDRKVVWHGFSQMQGYDGLIIQSAQGCVLRDIEGREFFDGASSMWCNIHGHAHRYINTAIAEQLSQIAHVTNLGMSHPITITLAKRLVECSPNGLEHVFFSSDGASAVEVALKLAVQFWLQCDRPEPKRTKFVALGSAYHGDTVGTVSLGGVERFHSMFKPLLFEALRGPCPDRYRAPKGMNETEAANHYLSSYQSLLERHAEEVAAIVVEPKVQGAAGVVMHPKGFLKGMRQLCDDFGCLLVADEIAVGMGRTGKLFACEHENISPDILCIGKGLTGGYVPMSATLTTTKIWNAFLGQPEDRKTFFHGHTYGGNPLSAAAAHATLDLFEIERTLEIMPEKSRLLNNRLQATLDHPQVGDVRVCGMLAAIEFVQNKRTKVPTAMRELVVEEICCRLLDHGVWLRPLGNVLPIIPPLSATVSELENLMDKIHQVVSTRSF
jgi:adenosylmethionine---8-amino-7-oxononanoate aminotransferase